MISEKAIAPDWFQSNATIRTIADELEAQLGRPMRGPGRVQLRIIVGNLFLRWAKGHAVASGFPMGASAFVPGAAWHRIGLKKSFATLVANLREKGFVEEHGGKINEFVSRYLPTDRLTAIFAQYDGSTVVFEAQKDRRFIVMNVGEGKGVRHVDLTDIQLPRDVEEREALLKTYNDLLSRSLIDVPGLERSFVERYSGTSKPHRIYLKADADVRSTFCRGSFDLGGRFYGGWWQSVGRAYRREIYINGEATVEVDFSSLHPRILYQEAGVVPVDDLYTLWDDAEPYYRSASKIMLLVMINSADEGNAIKAFGNEARKSIESFADDFHQMAKTNKGDRIDLLNALREKHEAISGSFFKDQGVRLQRVDSQIAEIVLRHFTNKGIPCLCIHDSFIVAKRHLNELKEIMTKAIKDVANVKSIRLSVKEGRKEEYPSKRYLDRLQCWLLRKY